MSDAKELDTRLLYWTDELTKLSDKNRETITKAMASSISGTLRDLRTAYGKFNTSEGETNRYTIEQQTARYRQLVKASESLLGPATIKQIEGIYQRDLQKAYATGGTASNDLSRIVGAKDTAIQKLNKMPVAAQMKAGSRLNVFWEKEAVQLRDKVTEATLTALQRGKGWTSAQRDIADALRGYGQTVLRSNDELSRTARGGILMNLEQRADLIARTELANAYIEGQMTQYRKNGYSHGRWSATGERSCAYCASREGVVYPLDELDGAIPAHPRCRCTVAPVLGEQVKRVQNATDKGAAAAAYLDDTGWTAIRQQRHSEYLKFTGKSSLDPAKWLNTPTSREKYLKGPNAKAAQPSWMPSGKATPDLKGAEAAAQRAKTLPAPSTELTPEEKIAQDVMNDKRFTSDAQRIREMRARLGKAGLNKDQDFVVLTASARAKTAEGAKATDKDLDAQVKEAKKAEKLQEKDQAKAKAAETAKQKEVLKAQKEASTELAKTVETLKQRVADTKARLQMAEVGLARIQKMKPEAEADLKAKGAKAKETAERYEKATKAVEVLNKEVAKQTKALASRQETLRKLNETIDGLTVKLEVMKADAKSPGSGQVGLGDVEYGQKIARMAHTKESFNRLSQDVLDRAGVDIKDLSSVAKTKKELLKKIDMDEYIIQNTKNRIKDTKQRIKDQEAKLKATPEDSKWMVEHTIEIHKRNMADDVKKLKEFEGNVASMKKELVTAPEVNPAVKAAQKVIDELYRTSALSAGDALTKVQAISGEANYRKLISERGVFKDTPNLTDLADAARMYGGLYNLRSYGVTDPRGFAVEPGYDPATNRFRENAPRNLNAFLNAGQGGTGEGGRFRKTQFHELGHFVEFSNTDIYMAAKEFIADHTKARKAPGKIDGYSRSEKFWEPVDGYKPISPYVLKDYTPAVNRVSEIDGKIYNLHEKRIPSKLHRLKDATEVTSMGLENLADAAKLANLAATDPDHLMLTLGVARLAQARSAAGIKQFNFEDFDNTVKAKASDIPVIEKVGKTAASRKLASAKEIGKAERGLKKAMRDREEFFELDWDSDPENLLEQANEKLAKIGDLDDLRVMAGRASVDLETARARVEAIDQDLAARNSRFKDLTEDLENYESDLEAIQNNLKQL